MAEGGASVCYAIGADSIAKEIRNDQESALFAVGKIGGKNSGSAGVQQ